MMLAPCVLAADHLLGGELGHPSQADLRSGVGRALRNGVGHLVEVTGRRVVDHCDLGHQRDSSRDSGRPARQNLLSRRNLTTTTGKRGRG
jgi:hypothetical protein